MTSNGHAMGDAIDDGYWASMEAALSEQPDHDERDISPPSERVETPMLAPVAKGHAGRPAGPTTMDGKTMGQHGIIRQFAAEHTGSMRYDAAARKWLMFSHSRSAWIPTQGILKVRAFLARLANELSDTEKSLREKFLSLRYAEEIERGARSEAALHTTPDMWDTNRDVLATPGGVIDLKVGEVRAASPDDLMRRHTSVSMAPNAGCPQWLRFVKESFGDAETVAFIQRYFGYCLSGRVREQKFLYLFGSGGNGKNLLAEVVADIMGTYARNIDIKTLMKRHGNEHMSELAVLDGARFVRTSEPDKDAKWNEGRLKGMTGDAVLTANLKYADESELDVTFKLVVLANPAPTFDDVGESMQRRLLAVFIPQPARRDEHLKDKLQAEYPAILRWLVQGAVDWYQGGLRVPERIVAASKNHLLQAHSDVRAWINERCRREGTSAGQEIQLSWDGYAKASLSTTNRSPSWLRAELEKEGIVRKRNNGTKYEGISVIYD
jgi:putative DNA primase/helicase